jgi:hypothetical protein
MPYPMTRKPGLRRALSCVRRSTRAAARTLPVERPSNSVTDGRSSVRQVETEVSDGLYLVVTGVVLHRFLHRDADYGIDVHVRFPVRTVGANSETRAGRLVGRVLTRQDWRADARRPLSANSYTLHRSNVVAVKEIVSTLSGRERAARPTRVRLKPGSFFWSSCNTLSTTRPIQRQHRMARIARPGRDVYPALAEPT